MIYGMELVRGVYMRKRKRNSKIVFLSSIFLLIFFLISHPLAEERYFVLYDIDCETDDGEDEEQDENDDGDDIVALNHFEL